MHACPTLQLPMSSKVENMSVIFTIVIGACSLGFCSKRFANIHLTLYANTSVLSYLGYTMDALGLYTM